MATLTSPATPPATPAAFESVFTPDWPLDLLRALSPHRRGTGDPTMRVADDGVWRTATTPDGAATVRIAHRSGSVRVSAWGPGAERAGSAVPDWLGAGDRTEDFDPGGHEGVTELHRTVRWLRLGRTRRAAGALVPRGPEQQVT